MMQTMPSGTAWFEPLIDWERLPQGMRHLDVADVAVDSHDRVHVLTRYESRVIVYERNGSFLRTWGEDVLSGRPHGLTIGPDDAVYLADEDAHTVRKYSADGSLLLTLGRPGVPADTGVDDAEPDVSRRIESIRGGPPFNRPTRAAIAPNGDIFVSDGYGNCRVHHFSASGVLMLSFGEPGGGPGGFRFPHDLAVAPDGRVLVADRENERVQVFSPEGTFLQAWTDLRRPSAIAIGPDHLVYVSEFPVPVGWTTWPRGVNRAYVRGRLSVFDLAGRRITSFGGDRPPCEAGELAAPHGLAIDSHGDVYVAEVIRSYLDLPSAKSPYPRLPDDCHTFQKLSRVTR